MKTFYISAFFLLIASLSYSQQLKLVDVVTISDDKENLIISKGDAKGGELKFNRTYTKACLGNYAIEWKFEEDISVLNKDDLINLTITCTNCKTPCGYRWTKATAGGANNILGDIGKYEMQYNGNISSTKSSGRVHSWYEGHLSHTFQLKANMNKEAPYTAFYITMGSHKIYYIYSSSAEKSKNINCHTLFGLGKLVAGMEAGSREDYGSSWVVQTIDYALDHVRASNCLSDAYLIDLRKRVFEASSTLQFEAEIKKYGVDLNTEIEENCSCCASCQDQ